MLFRGWIINFVLAAVVVFFGIKAYGVWSKEQEKLPEAGGVKHALPVSEKTPGKMEAPGESEYNVLVSHNLFSTLRSPDGEKQSGAETKPKPAGPDPNLLKILQETVKRISIYGVMMVNEEKKALIKSPVMPILGRERDHKQASRSGEEIRWVKVGDAVDRFTVNEIKRTGVVLGAEGLAFDVALYDKDKPKQRVFEKTAAGPIVIDTKKGVQAGSAPEKAEASKEKSPEKAEASKEKSPEKAEAPKEKSPEKVIPTEAGQRPMGLPMGLPGVTQRTEPEKR